MSQHFVIIFTILSAFYHILLPQTTSKIEYICFVRHWKPCCNTFFIHFAKSKPNSALNPSSFIALSKDKHRNTSWEWCKNIGLYHRYLYNFFTTNWQLSILFVWLQLLNTYSHFILCVYLGLQLHHILIVLFQIHCDGV